MPEPAEADIRTHVSELARLSLTDEGQDERSLLMDGLVIAISHGFFHVVRLRSAETDTPYLCTIRKRLVRSKPSPAAMPAKRRVAQPVSLRAREIRGREEVEQRLAGEDELLRIAVGERVKFRIVAPGQGVIEDVLPRSSAITRARSETGAAHVLLANADHAALVFAVREPAPHLGLLDRYLAICERAGVDVTIVMNKVDLGIPHEVETQIGLYRDLGYTLIYTSATTGAGLDALRERLHGRISLLTGSSGVGKSSLLNDLIPGAQQRIGAVSEATGKGRHTTTGARLIPLPGGGWLADSAGIRELALWNVLPEDLPNTFVELRPFVGACQYDDCEHTPNEEGCALRGALEAGRISPARFASFERLLAEAREAVTLGR